MSIKHAHRQTPVAMSDINTFDQLTMNWMELPQTARSGSRSATCERACLAGSGRCGDSYLWPGQPPVFGESKGPQTAKPPRLRV
jgi:hypothetical protein